MRRILVRHSDGSVDTRVDLDFLTDFLNDPLSTLWIDLEGEPPEVVEEVAGRLELHPVTVEDFLHRNQRPKIEEFEHYLFLVVHALQAIKGDEVQTDELHLVLKKTCLLTVYDRPLEAVKRVYDRCLADSHRLEQGPSFLLYLLSDAVADAYFPVLDAVGDEIDELEDAVVRSSARHLMKRIFDLKRVVVQLRKIVSPQREVYNALSRRDSPKIDPRTTVYFRDVHDHLVRAFEMIDSYRDLVSNTLDAYLVNINNRLSQVMKQMTVIATIFMPLTFITGFFGMNFTGLPFSTHWLLAITLAVIVILPAWMLLLFARRGWLTEGQPITSWARLRAWLRRRA